MASNLSFTEKGAIQYSSSMNPLVDFFRSAASQREMVLYNDDNILELFLNAYGADKKLAMKLAFWLRDPRGGAGEKAASQKIFRTLFNANQNVIVDNVDLLVKYGYWKDVLFYARSEKVLEYWIDKIKSGDKLAAKWAPRLHSKYHTLAKKFRDGLGFTNKQYRLMLKENSETVEQIMAKNYWKEIKYSSVPSVAMKKYKKAFDKRDKERFEAWKNDKNQKANSSVLYPYEAMKIALYEDDVLGQKLWDNLPDFIKDGESIMPIVDVSGSMEYEVVRGVSAMDIAISLGIYLAEKNKSKYQDKVITFSANPTFVDFSGSNSLTKKYEKVKRGNWGMTTNFEKAYMLILNAAVKNDIPKDKIPTMLLVLSDMQFDESQRSGWSYESVPKLHMDIIKDRFKDAGYVAPKLVFWNLREAYTGSPAASDSKDVALVSGFSPSIMKSILAAEEFNPFTIMLEAIDKYEVVTDNLPTLDELIKSTWATSKKGDIPEEMIDKLGAAMSQ